MDEAATVRGAFVLKHQDFWLKDHVLAIADYRLPLSEGAGQPKIPPSWRPVAPVRLGKATVAIRPRHGRLRRGARPLVRRGWMEHVLRPVLLSHPPTDRISAEHRTSSTPARLASAARHLGGDASGIISHSHGSGDSLPKNSVRSGGRDRGRRGIRRVERTTFGSRARGQYGMCAVRDSQTLRILYPASDPRFIRL